MAESTLWPLYERRRAVCRRCHSVMSDTEPNSPNAEYFHQDHFRDGKKNNCKNARQTFTIHDFAEKPKEIEPFMRKRDRRAVAKWR